MYAVNVFKGKNPRCESNGGWMRKRKSLLNLLHCLLGASNYHMRVEMPLHTTGIQDHDQGAFVVCQADR